jgi:pyruvate,water dikinase
MLTGLDYQTSMIALGSGRAAGVGVGNKGALLDRAAAAGLTVPRGFIVLDDAQLSTVTSGKAPVEPAAGIHPHPKHSIGATDVAVLARSFFPSQTSIAVRSAFSAEDGAGASLAGFFTSRLFVDAHDVQAVAEAVRDVLASAERRPGAFRRDVLLMEMVEAQYAGVAFTERAYEDDLVNFTTGTADTLVSGAVEGEALLLPKVRAWEKGVEIGDWRLKTANLPFALRLQALLRDVRRVFGSCDWDIEWADDGARCWLLQVRPVTRPTRRNEAFTVANHKEILPDPPSRFMTSVITSCANGLFAYYRRFDPELPLQRPFIETLYGRPLINLSLMTEMVRIWGLPTCIVTDSIGGETDRAVGLKFGRILRKAPVLLGQGFAQFGSVRSARRTIRAMLEQTEQPGDTFGACVETLRWLYTALVTEMFSLTAAMSGPLLALRAAGTLATHNARQRTIATEMYTDLEPLRALAACNPQIRAALEADALPDDPAFCAAWATYLRKHGHRGIYESDIARPRFHEASGPLLMALARMEDGRRGTNDGGRTTTDDRPTTNDERRTTDDGRGTEGGRGTDGGGQGADGGRGTDGGGQGADGGRGTDDGRGTDGRRGTDDGGQGDRRRTGDGRRGTGGGRRTTTDEQQTTDDRRR